jgi:hypothetical protein
MPRTLTEDWTETEISRGSGDETQLTRYWYEYRRKKSITVARFNLAKRAAIRQTLLVSHRETWSCPYCKWHSTARVKIRRSNIQQQFTQLADTWQQETAHQSNMTKRAMHPAYQRIVGMGPAVVPFILERFRKGALEQWFWALTAITGENPITEDIAGNMEKMAKAWVQGGIANGYLTDSTQHLKPSSQTLETEGTS